MLQTYSVDYVEGLLADVEARDLALETAWGIIANAYGGDWQLAGTDWHEAAIRWRDKYHNNLVPPPPAASSR